MSQYQTASEVEHWNKLFKQPIPIVAACNRAVAAQERSKWDGWWKGVFCGAVSVGMVLALVMSLDWWMQ